MTFPPRCWVLLLLALLGSSLVEAGIPLPTAASYPGTIGLQIDATDLERKIFSVRESIPVKPGHLVLQYPRWVPGAHAPIGNVIQLTGLRLSAQGRELRWARDPVEVFAFHVDVPAGVQSLDAQFEFVSPLLPAQGRVVMTSDMLHLQFEQVLLYPAGVQTDGVQVAASVKLPADWQYATALESAGRDGGLVRFKPTDLTTLVDSPLMAGRHFKSFALGAEGGLPVRFNGFAERDEAWQASEAALAPHRAMVSQAYKLFGPPPFAHYDFLMAFSDGIGGIGREHWQSTEITVPATYFADIASGAVRSFVVPHEFVHSWIGKFRRPADLITANFNTPMQNSLLWVYEGQTQYYGIVLETRAGFRKPDAARDSLASTIAAIDQRRGRSWRDLQDTVNDEIMAWRSTPRVWSSWQRQSGDYYAEGSLLWLGIDARLRALTDGRGSLDDFAAAFYADAPAARRIPKPYRIEDVVAALNRVAPFDWQRLLSERLNGHDDKVLTEDLPQTGWQLVYNATPNPHIEKVNKESGACDAFYSLGMIVAKTDAVSSVLWEGPAFKAGLAPGATVLGVNGKVFKCSELTAAISAAAGRDTPIELIVRRDKDIKVLQLRYSGGLRYPHLERVAGVPDRLEQIFAPR